MSMSATVFGCIELIRRKANNLFFEWNEYILYGYLCDIDNWNKKRGRPHPACVNVRGIPSCSLCFFLPPRCALRDWTCSLLSAATWLVPCVKEVPVLPELPDISASDEALLHCQRRLVSFWRHSPYHVTAPPVKPPLLSSGLVGDSLGCWRQVECVRNFIREHGRQRTDAHAKHWVDVRNAYPWSC